MMRWIACVFIVLASVSLSGESRAARIKAVLVSTSEVTIRGGTETSVSYVDELLTFVSKNLNLPYDKIYVRGDGFTIDNLAKTVKGVSVAPDDILVFYYNGHGFRSTKSMSISDRLPAMQINSGSNGESVGVPASDIYKSLTEKKARLTLAIFDSCNIVENKIPIDRVFRLGPEQAGERYIPIMPELVPGLRKLFVDTVGAIAMAGASPGEYGMVSFDNGGFFTNQLLNAIFGEAVYGDVASWSSVGRKAASPINVPYRGNANIQTPVIEINLRTGS